jgi:hypothetical protein
MAVRAHPDPPMWKRGMATRLTVESSIVEGVGTGQFDHGGDVAVGQHHALGQTGRTRRVQLHRHVVVLTDMTGVDAVAGAQPLFVRHPPGQIGGATDVGVGLGVTEDDNPVHRRQTTVHGRQARDELRMDHEDAGPGVVDDAAISAGEPDAS